MNSKKGLAFTLIELLVVIFIVAVLASLAIISLNNARSQARDSKKLADIRQIQTALELYFNENNSYPTADYFVFGSPLVSSSTGRILMQEIPSSYTTDNSNCFYDDYNYKANEDASEYSLFVCLENESKQFQSFNLVASPKSLSSLEDFSSNKASVKFDKEGAYLDLDNLNVEGDISIAFWLYIQEPIRSSIIQKGYHYSIHLLADLKVTWADSSIWNYSNFAYHDIGLTLRNWHYLVVTKSNNVVRIYLDGELRFSKTFGSSLRSANSTLFISGYSNNHTIPDRYFFYGNIDNLRIYERAISDEEVLSLYNNYDINNESLLLYLDFEELDTCTFKDLSGNENHAIIKEDCITGPELMYFSPYFNIN